MNNSKSIYHLIMQNLLYPAMLGNVIFLSVVAIHYSLVPKAFETGDPTLFYAFALASIFALSFVANHVEPACDQYWWLPFLLDLAELAVIILIFHYLNLFDNPRERPEAKNWTVIYALIAGIAFLEWLWDCSFPSRNRWSIMQYSSAISLFVLAAFLAPKFGPAFWWVMLLPILALLVLWLYDLLKPDSKDKSLNAAREILRGPRWQKHAFKDVLKDWWRWNLKR